MTLLHVMLACRICFSIALLYVWCCDYIPGRIHIELQSCLKHNAALLNYSTLALLMVTVQQVAQHSGCCSHWISWCGSNGKGHNSQRCSAYMCKDDSLTMDRRWIREPRSQHCSVSEACAFHPYTLLPVQVCALPWSNFGDVMCKCELIHCTTVRGHCKYSVHLVLIYVKFLILSISKST